MSRTIAHQHSGYRTLAVFFPAACLLSLVAATLSPSRLSARTDEGNSTTTFLVVRHTEREGNLDQLSESGEARAALLATIGNALNVQEVYSTDTKRTKGTAAPLAKAIDIETRIYRRPTAEWIASLKEKHMGQVVMIVGHSNTAGVIAGLLAGTPPVEIAHDEYDALFLVQLTADDSKFMRLRYGKSSKGAPSASADKMGEIDAARRPK